MKCHEFQELIEAYLGETIEEPRREEFEEHFFQCRKCFLGLKINESLRNKEVRIPLSEKPRLFAFKVLRPILVMSSLFLIILSSVLLLQRGRRAGQMRELARFDLPSYHQGEMRGNGVDDVVLEEQFSQAMRRFYQRDFRAVLDILDQPAFAAADNAKVAFFRAISLLELDQAEKAGETLDGIIQAMDPAYFDEALYYKGFVFLRLGKRAEALAQFRKLADMLSPMAGKARAMVQKIDEL
jgi:tetratricopeptide (TPR) repeat protein